MLTVARTARSSCAGCQGSAPKLRANASMPLECAKFTSFSQSCDVYGWWSKSAWTHRASEETHVGVPDDEMGDDELGLSGWVWNASGRSRSARCRHGRKDEMSAAPNEKETQLLCAC
jgi:hypothetical protein